MNIRMYTAAREATTKARNVASAIQQVTRQVNDDNKDIMDKVDKNTQTRSKRKAELELAAALGAKKLAEKQAKISKQQAGLAIAQIVTSVVASRVGKGLNKESENEDANVKDKVKNDKKDDNFGAKLGRVLAEAVGLNAVKGAFGKKDGGDDKKVDKSEGKSEDTKKSGKAEDTPEEPQEKKTLLAGIIDAVKKALKPEQSTDVSENGEKDSDSKESDKGTLAGRIGNAIKSAIDKNAPAEGAEQEGGREGLIGKIQAAVAGVLKEEKVSDNGEIPGEGTDQEKEDSLIAKITKAVKEVLGQEEPASTEVVSGGDSVESEARAGDLATGGGNNETVTQAPGSGNNETVTQAPGSGNNETVTQAPGGGNNETVTQAPGGGNNETVTQAPGGGNNETVTQAPGNGPTSPVVNDGPSAQTAAERNGDKGDLVDFSRGAGLSSIRGVNQALFALGFKKSDDPNQKPSGISEGTPIGDLLKQLADIINQINQLTSSGEGKKSRFGEFATKANRISFLLTEGTDEDLSGAGRFLRDLLGKPTQALATAPLNAASTGLQSLQNRANGNLAAPERGAADELAETGNVSLASQDALRGSLENRVRAKSGGTKTNEAGNRELTPDEAKAVQKGVNAFQGNVLNQKLGGDANVVVSSERPDGVKGPDLAPGQVLVSNGEITASNPGVAVSEQDVRRALAGDAAALERISTALKPNTTTGTTKDTTVGDGTTGSGTQTTSSTPAVKGTTEGAGAERASALGAENPATQALLDKVNSFAAKGVKGFEGAEIVNGEVTLTNGRTVTDGNNGGLQVNGVGSGSASLSITGDAVSALEGNSPIISDLETNRLVKGIDAGLNLSSTDGVNTSLNFDANAASVNTGVVGDRNNSVQLTFAGGTPEAEGRGLTVSPGGINQLSVRGIEKAADNDLGRRDRSALGLSGDRPRTRGLGISNDAPALGGRRDARANGRSAVDAAFDGAGITPADRSAQQGATDRSSLGRDLNIFGSARNRSRELSDPTEQLRDNSLQQAVGGVASKLRGFTNIADAQKALNDFKLTPDEQKGIITDNNDGTFSVSEGAIKKALEGRIGITRTAAATRNQTGDGDAPVPGDTATTSEGSSSTTPPTPVAQAGGANTTQDVQAVLTGNDALRTAAGATSGNVLGSFTINTDSVTVGEGERARGNSRISNGTGAGKDITNPDGNNGDGPSVTETNVRNETARRLSQSSAQGGLGLGRIDANSLVFDDEGKLSGIKVNGETQSLEDFAASNTKLSSAIAARRNRILGLSGKNAESGLNAEGIASRANGVLDNVRSESNSGLNSALSGASNAARTTLAALRGGNDEAFKNVTQTVNGDGSIALGTADGRNFLITADGKLQELNAQGEAEAAAASAFSNAIAGRTQGAAPSEADKALDAQFENRKKAIEKLTNDINDAFQVNFGLFKIGETVSNINVDFDAQGNITGAGVKLNDGSTFNLANDPSTGSLRAINARGANGAAINRSVNGGINYFNQQSRAGAGELAELQGGGFKGLLEGIGATNVSVDERDIGSSALQRDDRNSFNNNFTQEGRLRFDLNGQYLDVGYAIDKNGGVSLNLDGATDAQKAAIQTALTGTAEVNQARVPVSTSQGNSGNNNATTTSSNATEPVQTQQVAGINVRANQVIKGLQSDPDFQAALKTNDPDKIRSYISNKLQGSNLNTQVSNNLADAITNSNVTISQGQTLSRALETSGVTGDQATTVANALNSSDVVKKALAEPGGADSARVIDEALKKAGLTDAAQRAAITAKVLPTTTFKATEIGSGANPLDATTQFARLFGAGNRGNDALRDINGGLTQNLTPAQRQNARTQYNNTVAAERAIINSVANSTGAGNPRFLTVGLQAALGDEKASALVSTDQAKSERIAKFQSEIVGLNETEAQTRLNTFLRSEGLENNSIEVKEIANLDNGKVSGLKELSAVEAAIPGRVNVEASYDGRAQITGQNIQYGPAGPDGSRGKISSLSVTQDSSGKYSVNVGAGTGGAPTGVDGAVQNSLQNRYANPGDNQTGIQKFGEGLGSFIDGTTRFLGETLDAILPGLQAYKKAMEDLEEARVRLKAATDQVNAAKKYAAEMGVTFGSTNGDGGGEGGDGGGAGAVGAAGAAGGSAAGAAGGSQASGGGANGSGNVQGGNGNNGGTTNAQAAGSGEGAANTGAAGDNATPIQAQEAETAELLNAVASDSNFASIAVLIGLNPGMLIEQAQQMDMLDQLSDTIQQLQSPFSNPVQSMREFVERLEMAQNGDPSLQDGITI
jgi:hypothetical protein